MCINIPIGSNWWMTKDELLNYYYSYFTHYYNTRFDGLHQGKHMFPGERIKRDT